MNNFSINIYYSWKMNIGYITNFSFINSINLGAKLINNHQTAASLNEKAMRRTQEP